MASVCGLAVPSALQPQAGLWCHLTHYHPGHELAGLTRACQALCRHGIHYQLGDLGVCLYKRMVFSSLALIKCKCPQEICIVLRLKSSGARILDPKAY